MVQVQIPKSKFDLKNEKDQNDFLENIFRFGFTAYTHFPIIGEIDIRGRLIYANCSNGSTEYYIEYNDNRLYLVKYSQGIYLYLENKEKSEKIQLENVTKIYYHEPNLIIKYDI